MSSLWLMWFHGLYALPSFHNFLASTVPCIALSHLESWCKLLGASKPRDMIRSITHKPPYIFLKTATIPTYYGISIAIPRYIAMQLPSSSYTWLEHSLSYCLAWSCSWHCICGKATMHNLSYMSLLIHCPSRYTAGGIHIESYFVLSIEL